MTHHTGDIAELVIEDRRERQPNGAMHTWHEVRENGRYLCTCCEREDAERILAALSTSHDDVRGAAIEEAAKVAETPFDRAIAPSHKQLQFRKKIASAIRALAPTKEPKL